MKIKSMIAAMCIVFLASTSFAYDRATNYIRNCNFSKCAYKSVGQAIDEALEKPAWESGQGHGRGTYRQCAGDRDLAGETLQGPHPVRPHAQGVQDQRHILQWQGDERGVQEHVHHGTLQVIARAPAVERARRLLKRAGRSPGPVLVRPFLPAGRANPSLGQGLGLLARLGHTAILHVFLAQAIDQFAQLPGLPGERSCTWLLASLHGLERSGRDVAHGRPGRRPPRNRPGPAPGPGRRWPGSAPLFLPTAETMASSAWREVSGQRGAGLDAAGGLLGGGQVHSRPPSWISLMAMTTSLVAAMVSSRPACATLVGHHGEAASRLPGPGRLDGRVEGQEVGLVGDGPQ